MATKIAIGLVQAVAEFIDDFEYSEAFTVERVNLPVDDLSDLPTAEPTLVTVFPGVRELTGDYRDQPVRLYRVIVALRQKIPTDLTEAAILARQDELVGLGEEVEQSLEQSQFVVNGTTVVHVSSEGGIPFVPEVMESRNQFSFVLTLAYQVVL